MSVCLLNWDYETTPKCKIFPILDIDILKVKPNVSDLHTACTCVWKFMPKNAKREEQLKCQWLTGFLLTCVFHSYQIPCWYRATAPEARISCGWKGESANRRIRCSSTWRAQLQKQISQFVFIFLAPAACGLLQGVKVETLFLQENTRIAGTGAHQDQILFLLWSLDTHTGSGKTPKVEVNKASSKQMIPQEDRLKNVCRGQRTLGPLSFSVNETTWTYF